MIEYLTVIDYIDKCLTYVGLFPDNKCLNNNKKRLDMIIDNRQTAFGPVELLCTPSHERCIDTLFLERIEKRST